MKVLDDLQQKAEPLLGYDYYLWGGTHNVLLHRSNFQTTHLLERLSFPECRWYRLKPGTKGKGVHQAKLPILEMLRKRMLIGPCRQGNMQLILPDGEWARYMAGVAGPKAEQELLFPCEVPAELLSKNNKDYPIQICPADPLQILDKEE